MPGFLGRSCSWDSICAQTGCHVDVRLEPRLPKLWGQTTATLLGGHGLSVRVFPSQGVLSSHSPHPVHTVIWIASEFITNQEEGWRSLGGGGRQRSRFVATLILKKDAPAATWGSTVGQRPHRTLYRGSSLIFTTILKTRHQVPPFWVSWWLSGKESTCQCRRCRFNPRVGKTP